MKTHDHSPKKEAKSSEIYPGQTDKISDSSDFSIIQAALERANKETLRPDIIMRLQHTIGNQAVQRLLDKANHDRVESSPSDTISSMNRPDNLQRYFTKEAARGSINAFFGPSRASESDLAAILKYLQELHGDLVDEFQTKASSDTDEGTLSAWITAKLGTTLEKIKEHNTIVAIKKEYPGTEKIPESWIRDPGKVTSNVGGPPMVLEASQQDEASSSDEDRVDEVKDTDMVIDVSKSHYELKGQQYPIAEGDRSDVRASAMLDNAHLSSLSSPLTYQSNQAPVQGTQYARGEKKGQPKSLRDAADEVTRRERERKRKEDPEAYEDKVLSHHPDISLTGVPFSPTGLHPQSRTANTLEGLGSGYQSIGSRVKRVVVREQSGKHFAYSLEGRQRRKAKQQAASASASGALGDPGQIGGSTQTNTTAISSSVGGHPKMDTSGATSASILDDSGDESSYSDDGIIDELDPQEYAYEEMIGKQNTRHIDTYPDFLGILDAKGERQLVVQYISGDYEILISLRNDESISSHERQSIALAAQFLQNFGKGTLNLYQTKVFLKGIYGINHPNAKAIIDKYLAFKSPFDK